MKKVFLALAAVATLFATSCKKESVNPAIDVPEGSFIATIDGDLAQNAPEVSDGMGTMTSTDGTRIYWETGDEISINGGKYTTNADNKNAVFNFSSGTQASGGTYHAFYPYGIQTGSGASGTFGATQYFDTEMSSDGNRHIVSNIPLYAYSQSNSLAFGNIFAVLKLTMPYEVKQIEISSDETVMNGNFTVGQDANDNNVRKALMSDAATADNKKLTILPKNSTTFAGGSVVYVALPSTTYATFKIKLKKTNDTYSSNPMEKTNLKLKINKIYKVSFPSEITPDYFCLTVRTAGTLALPQYRTGLEYRKSTDTDWTTYSPGSSSSTTIYSNLSVGEKIYFRSSSTTQKTYLYGASSNSLISNSSTATFNVSGNIMYLLKQENPGNTFQQPQSWETGAFQNLFKDCTKIFDASGLSLPATAMVKDCYYRMFYGCANLVNGPAEISATVSAEGCCYQMFYGCYALKKGPVLRAEKLTKKCFYQMFYGCSVIEEVTLYAKTDLSTTDYTNSDGALYGFLATNTISPKIWAGSNSNASINIFHCTQAFYEVFSNTTIIKTDAYTSGNKKYWEWSVDVTN